MKPSIKLTFILFVFHVSASVQAELSSYDVSAKALWIPCVEAFNNGQPSGDNGTSVAYEAEMLMVDNILRVSYIDTINIPADCGAGFDFGTGVYTDIVSFEDDTLEVRMNLIQDLDFSISELLFQRNFISEQITVDENNSTSLTLPSQIDTEILSMRLDDRSNIPAFIGLNGNELTINPNQGDEGVYELRLVWGSEIEHLTITVNPSSSGNIDYANQPTTMPIFSSIDLYSPTSPFNTPIGANPSIDPDSAQLVQSIVDSISMVVQVKQYSAPVYFADNSTPKHNVELTCGEEYELGVSHLAGVPIPDWAAPADDVDGANNPPVGCGGDSDQDNFMVILDMENRCEYDLWQARKINGQWQASFANAASLDGSGVNPNGLSARGSGFAFLGGLIWPDELASGEIKHPLAFSYEFTKAGGPVAPATDSDGLSTLDKALPEGAIIQLDPNLDLNSFNLEPYEKTIAKALQEYGMILVDSGAAGPIGFYAIDPKSVVNGNAYENLWPDEDFVALANLDVTTLPFRVLELPPQDTDYRSKLALASNSCANYQ